MQFDVGDPVHTYVLGHLHQIALFKMVTMTMTYISSKKEYQTWICIFVYPVCPVVVFHKLRIAKKHPYYWSNCILSCSCVVFLSVFWSLTNVKIATKILDIVEQILTTGKKEDLFTKYIFWTFWQLYPCIRVVLYCISKTGGQ